MSSDLSTPPPPAAGAEPARAPRWRRAPLAVQAGLALVAGLAVGLAIRASGSAALARVGSGIAPLGTLWVNAIRMTVIPLVVSLLIAAIASARDARQVGRVGGRALAIFVALLGAIAAVVALVAPALYAGLTIDPTAVAALRASVGDVAATARELPTFGAWLVGLVPANPLRAAADGAMLPTIVFTAAFALAIGAMPGTSREPLLRFFQGVADAMLVLVRWILALAPVGIFALAVTLATQLGAAAAGAVGYYLVVHSGLLIGAILLLYPIARVAGRVPVARFARACLPAQAVALGTRSSLAALPAMIEGAQRTLGVPREVAGFVLPFAVSTFRLNQAVSWVATALFIARLYGIDLGAAEIATLALASVGMSFSVPGIPSGGIFVMAPFFPAVGLPIEGIGILIALDAVPDLFKTTLNVTGHMTATAILSRGEATAADAPERGRHDHPVDSLRAVAEPTTARR